MKINKIILDRSYNKGIDLNDLTITVNFDTSNPSNKPDGDALYYLICALDKMNSKSHKDLDFMEKMEVHNRLDSAIAKLQQIRQEIKC
jgi:hypothetical protein